MTKQKTIDQPKAKIITKTLQNQDSTRTDDYFWMNDRENPEVLDYLKNENEFKDFCLKKTDSLQKTLFKEMKSRIKEDDASVPYFKNGFYYYNRFEKGKEYPIYCRKEGNLEADEKTLLNINTLAEGQEYMNVNALAVAENNQLLAYSLDNIGRRIYTIQFKDLISGEVLEDRLKSVTGNLAWAADNATVFYSQQDSMTLRPNKIFRHVLGKPQESDELVYEETDETFTVGLKKSKSRKFLFIASQSTISSEYRCLPLDQPDENWKIIQERQADLEWIFGRYLYLLYFVTPAILIMINFII